MVTDAQSCCLRANVRSRHKLLLLVSRFIKTNTAFSRRASATRLGFGVATRSGAVHLLCTVHRSFWADTLCYLTFEGAVHHSCCVDNFRGGAVQFKICTNPVFLATDWTTKRSTIVIDSKSKSVSANPLFSLPHLCLEQHSSTLRPLRLPSSDCRTA